VAVSVTCQGVLRWFLVKVCLVSGLVCLINCGVLVTRLSVAMQAVIVISIVANFPEKKPKTTTPPIKNRHTH